MEHLDAGCLEVMLVRSGTALVNAVLERINAAQSMPATG
jgi:hypothetical protein